VKSSLVVGNGILLSQYSGTLKNFHGTIFMTAHRAVIFVTAQLSCCCRRQQEKRKGTQSHK